MSEEKLFTIAALTIPFAIIFSALGVRFLTLMGF
jgi:hypothetical protein